MAPPSFSSFPDLSGKQSKLTTKSSQSASNSFNASSNIRPHATDFLEQIGQELGLQEESESSNSSWQRDRQGNARKDKGKEREHRRDRTEEKTDRKSSKRSKDRSERTDDVSPPGELLPVFLADQVDGSSAMISSRFRVRKCRNQGIRRRIRYSIQIIKAMISISAMVDCTRVTYLAIDVWVVSPSAQCTGRQLIEYAAGRVVGLNSGLRITKDTAYSGRGLMVDVSSSAKVGHAEQFPESIC